MDEKVKADDGPGHAGLAVELGVAKQAVESGQWCSRPSY